MNKFFLGFLLVFLLNSLNVNAQQTPGRCGVSPAEQELLIERLEANRAAVAAGEIIMDRGVIRYVPIHFHQVGSSTGGGRGRDRVVLEQICRLNAEYASADIQFYLSPHPQHGWFDKSISNDNVYSDQANTTLMNARRHPNAVNIYVVQDATSNSGSIGTTLGYFNPQFDWLVIRKNDITGEKSVGTSGHEIGHFFSLSHTFRGWDSKPFDTTFASWPVAPVTSPGGAPTEKVDGSNCTTAGDRICDTPPDYNFGFGWDGCTPYTGGALDPMSQLVDPMENNFMGYFIGCTQGYVFTPGQATAMNNDLSASKRNYLDNNFVPAATEIITPTDLLVAPDNGMVTSFYDQVTLQWKSVAGATLYFIEVDINSGFASSQLQTFLQEDTSLTLTNLIPNRNYSWRVMPVNEYYMCAASRLRTFRTSQTSGVIDIPAVSGWQISPNPVAAGQNLQVTVQAISGFDAKLTLFDITGRVVGTPQQMTVNAGPNQFNITTANLRSGIYLLSLEGEAGKMVKRIVVE